MEALQNAEFLLIAGLVVDRVLTGLKERGIDLRKMSQQTQDLWDWHAQTDTDGVKVWYVRQSLAEAIKIIAESEKRTADMLEALLKHMDRNHEEIKRIRGVLGTNGPAGL